MARECGWDYKYIVKNLTFSQIKRYYETIHNLKQIEFAKQMEGTFHAVAAAHGNIKVDAFNDYLMSNLSDKNKPKKDVTKTIDKMKHDGFEIEEH